MADQSGQVTIILRSIEKRWRDEYLLNLMAAAATKSNFSHVELAIGDEAGQSQQMSNVLRIYNDAVGAELCQRTGKSPNYRYLQIGCSKQAEDRMLRFAREQVGKPFSMTAMLRSVVYPRTTDFRSFFCAELVAATLREGGLMHHASNPGSVTPQSLYELYAPSAAVSGNPMTLRLLSSAHHDLECGRPSAPPAVRPRAPPATVQPQLRPQPQPQPHLHGPAWSALAGDLHTTGVADPSLARPIGGLAAAGDVGSRAEQRIRSATRNAIARQQQQLQLQLQQQRQHQQGARGGMYCNGPLGMPSRPKSHC
jgi:hypothetical protein